MTELPVYVLERIFDSAPELVWRAWTEPELLGKWYGPNVETIIHQLDVAEGGLWLNEMNWGEQSNFQKSEFIEVIEPSKLVFLQSVTDSDWNVIANPMMPDWPRKLLTTVTFVAEDGKTRMRLEWVPHDASDAEVECFRGALAGLDKGWGSGMDQLARLLADLDI